MADRVDVIKRITSYLANSDSLTDVQISDLFRECRRALALPAEPPQDKSSGAEAQLGEGERGLSQPSSRQGPFSPEVELRNLCAEMYQIAGVLEAPAKVLDQLSAGAQGKKLPHSTLLPFICKGETQP